MAKATLEERFWSKVNKTETCWLWTRGKTKAGYGHVWNGQKVVYAHRLAYELLVGPIPEGLTIDHVKANGCTSTLCVKAIADEHGPAHLEPVTQGENGRRGTSAQRTRERHAAQTHCKRGHLFDEANTRIGTHGERRCRKCLNLLGKKYRAALPRDVINARKRANYARNKEHILAYQRERYRALKNKGA